MALIKEKTNEQGVTYNYWVAQEQPNAKDKTTNVLMLGFKSKADRDNGSNFIERIRINRNIPKLYVTGEEVYNFAKTSVMGNNPNMEGEETEPVETNWFADAVDDN